MPSRNTIKEFAANEYYHVYNRGVEKRDIFLDDEDYAVFMGLLKKYLSAVNNKKLRNYDKTNLHDEVELLAYCLMANHFHLLLYQKSQEGVTKLMRRVMTGYVMYFNNKYDRVGALFQGRYKASHINADAYLHHVSRYIHLNPTDYKKWPYSSLGCYLGEQEDSDWLQTQRVMELFDSTDDYRQFLESYTDTKRELDAIKWQLANNSEL